MNLPACPPRMSDLWTKVGGPDRLMEVLSGAPEPTVNGKYLHWDKLRHYPPPTSLSHEDWWFALKVHREGLRKQVPLLDKKDGPFSFLLMDPIPERLHEIDLSAGGRIEISDKITEQITNPDTCDRYYIGSLIEEAITSSQLEGATTTRPVAKDMIRSGRPPRDRSEQMILNNFLTMRRIRQLKGKPLTKKLVLEIHRLVTDQTLDDPTAAGRFRGSGERVVVSDDYGEVFHEPPPADQLEKRLAAMCDFANGKTPDGFVHPVIRSIVLHFWLAYDHPFVDGNGRTARALFYWSMLRHGFWLCEFISISQTIVKAPAKYGRAFLYTETDDNDLTYFILYHLEVIRRAIKQLHQYIGRKTKQLQALERQLRGSGVLNHRQRALVAHALRHPEQRYTVKSHRLSHNVVNQTARTDLIDLRDRGLLKESKVGRNLYYTPAEGIEKTLGELS